MKKSHPKYVLDEREICFDWVIKSGSVIYSPIFWREVLDMVSISLTVFQWDKPETYIKKYSHDLNYT